MATPKNSPTSKSTKSKSKSSKSKKKNELITKGTVEGAPLNPQQAAPSNYNGQIVTGGGNYGGTTPDNQYAVKMSGVEGSYSRNSKGNTIPFDDGAYTGSGRITENGYSDSVIKNSNNGLESALTPESDKDLLENLNFIGSKSTDGNYSPMAKALSHYMHMPGPGEKYIDRMYDSIFRFGAFNTDSYFHNGKEFLFFTRPDLNIFATDNAGNLSEGTLQLNPGLTNGFWQDVASSKKRIIAELQSSYARIRNKKFYDPFNHLLQNQCNSNLDIPSLSANAVETSTNMYGVGFSYRGSSEESDDQVEFSLEFKDTRWLDIYYYFKTFEEYETEKHHGTVRPARPYINNRIIHDQFSIYKFIVAEDMETLVYWGKMYGVMPMSLPRDTFSTDNFDNGLSHSINFKAAFYEDMRPEILSEFNNLCKEYWDYLGSQGNGCDIGIYNPILGRTDGRWPKCAHILTLDGTGSSPDKIAQVSPNGYRYKLAWRGDTKV